MKQIPVVPCHISELNISCYGCCGNNFSARVEIEEDIKLNSEELGTLGRILDTKKLISFRDRFDSQNALSLTGLCYNVVDLGGGCFGCPLHPLVNNLNPKKFKIENTDDLRVNHCDINEECDTFKAWKRMTDDDKLEFISWLKLKGYDSYTYSKENGEDVLLKKILK